MDSYLLIFDINIYKYTLPEQFPVVSHSTLRFVRREATLERVEALGVLRRRQQPVAFCSTAVDNR